MLVVHCVNKNASYVNIQLAFPNTRCVFEGYSNNKALTASAERGRLATKPDACKFRGVIYPVHSAEKVKEFQYDNNNVNNNNLNNIKDNNNTLRKRTKSTVVLHSIQPINQRCK